MLTKLTALTIIEDRFGKLGPRVTIGNAQSRLLRRIKEAYETFLRAPQAS
jgi:hypothetical protein